MHWSILLLPLVLATLPICHSVQSHSPLEHRDSLQNLTNVTCQPSFDWARNSAQQSPCIVAVATYYACSGPLEEIPSLSPGYHYDTPGETTGPGTANGPLDQCTCSWVAYNLFSVCTACQGDNDSIITWDTYTINCTGLTEDSTYYPSNVIPEDNTSIPYYATINRMFPPPSLTIKLLSSSLTHTGLASQWKNAVFDIDQAKNISSQGETASFFVLYHDNSVRASRYYLRCCFGTIQKQKCGCDCRWFSGWRNRSFTHRSRYCILYLQKTKTEKPRLFEVIFANYAILNDPSQYVHGY
ncbi:hypothetical protein BT96DRAFT_626867 [Gymnopus androsaceus JB14]|uniref:Uncharacterized protein n=1 Tax=Gymnopus androsaceus JB14 TaxID=1447944 RepID=A0A6A4IGR4_9AGAR|nr:hypothetical protein BT96DRAFT_626867 [Gymnopus androsaceus JB14]